MHIGILTAGHVPAELRPHSGDYETVFAKFLENQGLTFQNWDVVDMDFPNSIDAAEGWLITGSRHGVYEDHPFIPPLIQFIQAAFIAQVPMVGICFGHQIIAQAMGGRVEKSTKGWGVGRQVYSYAGAEVTLNAWHQDQVVEKPPLATSIAQNAFCEHAGFLYGKQALTLQPHPEFRDDFMAGLIEHRAPGVVPENRLDYARAQLGGPTDGVQIAADIAAFFHLDREEPA
ncbi:type 1 glutamine amidotransferase [Actibacterium sp. 188UL27-1]|uniref:type 1 glutamine amidotransferase n=1 Tax=Actibacterium sp. 188UL27-1 TaxID=2786961 RepID=UPI0019576DFB|nr:type 1 glutamine amidotransferase [Actibacterium sp. 188UL27-1]MBM7068262.1 type 1 glutamine amidotransferase [Actibacterium sp. 188UL27-1]